jgi:ADP-heptose:LPS heptosyltransferase
VEEILAVARHLGIPDPRPRHVLPDDAEAGAWAERTVRELGAAPVIVNLGASKPPNRWEPERFGRFARRCARELAPVVLTGGPQDRPAARRLRSRKPLTNCPAESNW